MLHHPVATCHAARTDSRQAVWLCAPSCKALDVSVSEGRPGEGGAVASGVMAEAGVIVPTSDSELACWSKVSVVQLQPMSMHERLCAATLLAPFRARTHDACLGSSIAAPYGVAWVQESPCGIAAVPRGGRRALTDGEKVGFNVL